LEKQMRSRTTKNWWLAFTLASAWVVAAAQVNQATPVQSAPQDLLILVRKNDSGSNLKFVKTLDGNVRLSSTQESLWTSACIVGFPDPSGRMADANVEEAARAELRRYLAQLANIKDVRVIVNYRPCSRYPGRDFHLGGGTDLVLIQSQSVDLVKLLYGYDQYEQLHKISYASLVAVAGEMRSAENQRQEVLDRRAQELDALAQSGSTEKVGSLAFFTPHSPGRGVTFCTLSYDGEKGAAVLGYGYRGIATQAEAFRAEAERVRATVNTSRPYGKVYATADALYEELLSQQECMVYVDFPANLKKLSAALQRDGKRAPLLGELVSSMELKDGWAQRTGYQNYAEYQVTREMNVSAQQFKQLAEYRIADRSALDAVMREMQVSGYSNSSEVQDALIFLKDKAEAAGRNGATALSVRNARQKAERETSSAEAAAEQRRREAVAKDFPYIAVLTCGMPRHVNIMGCFAGGSSRVSTELKLRNGTDTVLFKTYNLHQAGKERADGFYIDLRRNFDLRAQNADENLILGLKIIDRVSGRVLKNDQAARFDVVSARN
jgi:hypothetical protein